MGYTYYLLYPSGFPADKPSSVECSRGSLSYGSFPRFGFGVEIEAVVQPRKIKPEWKYKPEEYYKKLASALRKRGLSAVADDLNGSHRSHPEHYDKWFITKDGSLRGERDEVCLEAVSPVLRSGTTAWEDELEFFWEAMTKLFKIRENFTCGSHVHVAPLDRRYTLSELKTIAFAVVIYEDIVHYILPEKRRTSTYCKRNSRVSPKLKQMLFSGKNNTTFNAVGKKIKQMTTTQELYEFMQGNETDSRYVVWNFKNISGTSGTIEFRGGRHLRGPNRTFWWVTLAVAFISLALREDRLGRNDSIYNPPSDFAGSFLSQLSRLWESIKDEADMLRMGEYLPSSWQRMKELEGSSR